MNERIRELAEQADGYSADFEFHQCLARAVERAHGIGGDA